MLRLAAAARHFSSAAAAPLRVCVVGSGPSGFYAAKYLLKDHAACSVDVLDALPNPYGAPRRAAARARC